jgi:hypothetical protein
MTHPAGCSTAHTAVFVRWGGDHLSGLGQDSHGGGEAQQRRAAPGQRPDDDKGAGGNHIRPAALHHRQDAERLWQVWQVQ